MSGVCLVLAGKSVLVAASAFTLAWTHSVQKTRWEEDWRLSDAGLELVEARIEGSGAGMEVPDGAVREGGVWRYRPNLPPQPALLLARSGATGGGWQICADGRCLDFGADAGAPAELGPCR